MAYQLKNGSQGMRLKTLPYKFYKYTFIMKKILLAGGAGYIGTELCKRLQRLDYKVTVIDELWFDKVIWSDKKWFVLTPSPSLGSWDKVSAEYNRVIKINCGGLCQQQQQGQAHQDGT